MSKYGLTEKEISQISSNLYDRESAPYWIGRNHEAERLIPLLESKDQLLRECRTVLTAIKEVAETVHSDNPNEVAYYKEAIALLTKLQSI